MNQGKDIKFLEKTKNPDRKPPGRQNLPRISKIHIIKVLSIRTQVLEYEL